MTQLIRLHATAESLRTRGINMLVMNAMSCEPGLQRLNEGMVLVVDGSLDDKIGL